MTDVSLHAVQNYYWALQDLKDADSINKLYRHARIWTRFSRVFAETISTEEGVEVNAQFKRMKKERLEELQDEESSD